MNLKKASLFAIAGIVYIIILKLAVSIHPDLLTIESLLKTTKLLTILTISALLVFAYYFYKEFIKPEQLQLKYATIALALFIFINLLYHLKQLPQVFPALNTFLYNHLYVLYLAGSFRYPGYLYPFSGFLSSIFVFYFFLIFYNELKKQTLTLLTKATFYMLLVSGIGILIRFSTLIIYFAYEDYGQVLNSSSLIYFVVYPVFVISSTAQIYFFWTFYKTADSGLV